MKLLYNARFYTMRQEGEFSSAVLIDKKGMIIDVYNSVPILDNVEKINLNGAFVYPGFVDTHTHSFEGGLYSLGADLGNVDNLDEVSQLLKEASPVSGKIFAYHFDENNIAEKRFPTALELDKLYPNTPVILRRVDGHSCVINTIAAKMIDWQKPLPVDFNGHLSQRWNGRASNWFHRNMDDEGILKAYHKAAEIAVQNGHTAVHTMIGNAYSNPKHFKLIQDHINDYPIEFELYPQITDVKVALELGAKRIGGCVLADGSIGSHSAALLQPYTDDPENYGVLYRTTKEWQKFILEAHANNLQIAVHCIGDAAITQILDLYERVQNKDRKDLRHEIIHNELTSDEIIDRIAKTGCSAVMQPMFDRLWGGSGGLYETRLGKERTSSMNRLASIYKKGILLTGGSDWYITDVHALKGIDAATRMHNENERLIPYQAVEIYTKNAAILSFDEDRCGTIEIGKQADLTCLQEDIFTSNNIANIKVQKVLKKGKEIYGKYEE
jgi:predicted amidohydrolase YtcJ